MKSIILYGFYFCGLFVLLGNVHAEKHWIKRSTELRLLTLKSGHQTIVLCKIIH